MLDFITRNTKTFQQIDDEIIIFLYCYVKK